MDFAPDLRCSTIILTGGEIEIAMNLSIKGPGPSAQAASGDNASRIITSASGITAAISGLTIENGRDFNQGGSTFAS